MRIPYRWRQKDEEKEEVRSNNASQKKDLLSTQWALIIPTLYPQTTFDSRMIPKRTSLKDYFLRGVMLLPPSPYNYANPPTRNSHVETERGVYNDVHLLHLHLPHSILAEGTTIYA